MRNLTRSEKRLLGALLGTLFVLANLFGVVALLHMKTALEDEAPKLRGELIDSEGWLAEKELWMDRKTWLDAKEPRLEAAGEASAKLLESLQTSARRQKITILEQEFPEPSKQPEYQEISVKLKVSASLESLTRWLVELQQPELFQVVSTFSLKSDAEPPKVICNLQVARWYAPAVSP